MTKLPDGVTVDAASQYRFDQFLDKEFLLKVFSALQEMMGSQFSDYDWHIVSTHNTAVVPESADSPSPRKVLLFTSDESSSVPQHLSDRYFAIFKAYLPAELPGTNIFPLSLGYVGDVPTCTPPKPILDRSINVFFAGNLNESRIAFYCGLHPILRRLPTSAARNVLRGAAHARLRFLLDPAFSSVLSPSVLRFTDGFRKGFAPGEYGSLLNESKIVLCPKGFRSSETFRYYESMRAGAIVFSEPLPDTHFYRGSPAITVSDWRTALAIAEDILKDPARQVELQKSSIRWWQQVCGETATASYIAEVLRRLEASAKRKSIKASSGATRDDLSGAGCREERGEN